MKKPRDGCAMRNIGSYEIVETIDPQEPLYLVRNSEGRNIVLKTIQLAGLSPEDRERLLQDAQTRRGFDHPDLVKVLETGVADDFLFVTLDLTQGHTLSNLLAQGRQFSWEEKLTIMEQVCDGLQFAHERGEVHGLLGPSNIYLESSGKVRVLDLGVVRAAQASAHQTGHAPAPVIYMSPEQIGGGGPTSASDVFSAGVIFYELAAGKHPFSKEGWPLEQLVIAIASEQPAKLSGICPDAPEGLEFILGKALEKDPIQRIQNAGDFKQALSLCRITMKLGISRRSVDQSTNTSQSGDLIRTFGEPMPAAPDDSEKTKVMSLRRPSADSPMQRASRIETLLKNARTLIDQGNLASAQTLLREAHQLDPGNLPVRQLRAQVEDKTKAEAARQSRTIPVDRSKDSDVVRTQRALDLALAERVPVYVPVELIAYIRRPESEGLGALLDADRDSTLKSGDVRSRPMGLDLPKDAKGRVRHTDLVMRVTAPDFEPRSQEKTVRVYPDSDCERQTFLLTPQHTGDLRIQFDVLQSGLAVASRLLRAEAAASDRLPPGERKSLVLTVPIDVHVDPAGAPTPFLSHPDYWKRFEGRVIENTYRLTKLLGSGGYGGVFLADHLVENRRMRQVALKLILSDPDQLDRQLRELSASTNLHHPHLLTCHHAGSVALDSARFLYLAMEVAGESLHSRLSRSLLTPAESIALAEQILGAVICLHEQKFVHRDIKPANVLRVGAVWKLSDFGTIRESAGPATDRTSVITGTVHYMPPESFEGVVTPAWDVWSFGIMLLQSLSRTPAFEGKSKQELMWAIIRNDPAIPNDLPSPLREVVRACLTKNHRDRWSAERALESLRPRHASPPVATPLWRQRKLLVGVLIFLLLLIVGLMIRLVVR